VCLLQDHTWHRSKEAPDCCMLQHVIDKAIDKKAKADIALHGNPISELRDVTCHMGSHSVTCQPTQVNAPRLTPAMQAGTRFTYPWLMEGWVGLVDLTEPRPGVELVTFRSQGRRGTGTAKPPRQQVAWMAAYLLNISNICFDNMNSVLTYYC